MLTVINPKEAYQGITVEHLGLIPSILREASEQIDIHSKETFLDAVEEAYGFPMYEMKGELLRTVLTSILKMMT